MRQEQYARSGAGPDIKNQTAWLDFISSIADNTVDLRYCQIISFLFRALAICHSTAEFRSHEGRDGRLIDLRPGVYISIFCHFFVIFFVQEKDHGSPGYQCQKRFTRP